MTRPINFDSPWEAIVEAAQTPVSAGAKPARLLSDAEICDLTGLPVCVVEAEGAPAPSDRPARGAFLREQAERKGWQYAEYVDWPDVGKKLGSSAWSYNRPVGASGVPPVRLGAGFGSENDMRAPLTHRLSGDRMKLLGVIVDGHQESIGSRLFVQCGVPLQSHQVIGQLHEMFHLVQLMNTDPKDPLLDIVQRERDADQAAVTAFQTHCNGSPVDAARYIMARTVDTVGQCTEEYFFWPGLGADELLHGPLVANSLFLLGMYEQAGQARPASALMEQWALQAFMPRDMYEQHCVELDGVNTFVAETVRQDPLGPVVALRGIAAALERKDSYLDGRREDLARKVVQAARILRPDWLNPS